MTDRSFLLAWRGALGAFVLAGSTGVLYRIGLATGWTAGFDLVNIRHAHSHLMYFGWVMPALFALMGTYLSPAPSTRRLPRVIGACFAAALLAYPLFLAFGYRPVDLGEARLPLAVIAASLNMLVWYGFVLYYRRARRGRPRSHALHLWDAAVTFLVLATLGAWGLALLQPFGIDDPRWTTALTHVFLDYVSEGWFVLAVLGLAYAVLAPRTGWWDRTSLYLMVAGLPVTFALGMPGSLVPATLRWLAGFGGALVGTGLWIAVVRLWGVADGRWRVPLAFLALKATGQVIVGLLPGLWWADLHGLRVLYLHLMLLGFVSTGLAAAAAMLRRRVAGRGTAVFYLAVGVVLASLLPFTPLWPAGWRGPWAFDVAAWLSPLPVLAAAWLIVRTRPGLDQEPR